MLNFQSSGVGLSLIQTQSHIPPRSTSLSSGPSFFYSQRSGAGPGKLPGRLPGIHRASRSSRPGDLNSSNSHIYNVKLALVELSRQICSPNGAPGSSDLGVSIYKSQIADHKSQIANWSGEFSDLEIADRIFFYLTKSLFF